MKKIYTFIAIAVAVVLLSLLFVFIQKMKHKENEFDDRCENAAWRVYENSAQFEGDIVYVNEEMFEILKSAYEEIEFTGEFEKGNVELYDRYKDIFSAFLQNQIPYWDNEKGEPAYIEDIYELSTYIDSADNVQNYPYKYFFWDIDMDGEPELGVQNYEWGHEKFFFDYDSEIARCFFTGG